MEHSGSVWSDVLLTGSEEVAHPQEVEGDSHDGGFVQVGGDSTGEWQSAGELVKHLRLLTPPTSGRITRTQLPLLRTGPAGGGGTRGGGGGHRGTGHEQR